MEPISDGRYHSPDWPDNSIHETTSEEENISNPEDGSDVDLPFSPYRQRTTISRRSVDQSQQSAHIAIRSSDHRQPNSRNKRPASVAIDSQTESVVETENRPTKRPRLNWTLELAYELLQFVPQL